MTNNTIDIIYGHRDNFDISSEIETIISECFDSISIKGTLYFGYPIVAKQYEEEKLLVEALFITEKHGVIVFTPSNLSKEEIEKYQDDLFVLFESKLKSNDNLKNRRDLIPSLLVVTYQPAKIDIDYTFTNCEEFKKYLDEAKEKEEENQKSFPYINTVIESLVNLKPKRKRDIIDENSLGAIVRDIEKQIANLDGYQKKAALEISNGPQRIRGLAGSGKTIVLALKAAYLHTAFPDKKICITFNTRSLKEQFIDLVRRFTFEHINDEPNWDNFFIIHAWGSNTDNGIYYNLCKLYEQNFYNFNNAKYKFGYDKAFQGACDELLNNIKGQKNKPIFDILLIDEAQDLPRSFFELSLKLIKEDKHIIWAYDELQNIGKYTMESPEKLFGTSSDGTPNIKELINHPKQPRKDIVLKTCYRNPPNILATAHALGFGINREGTSSDRFIQFFDEPSFWNDIRYKTVSGELGFGKDVEIERDKDFVPSFFEERLDMKNNLITKSFLGLKEQYEYLAKQIRKNITEDELLPTDILIINGNPMTTKNDLLPLKNYLAKIGIDSHLAGVTSSVDEFFIDGKITLSGIYRAKGNEAPMVYIVNSEYCYEGIDISTRRNILFTAMTRTKAWAQVLGCGRSMDSLIGEIDTLRKNDFKLKFKYPTKEELKKLRKIHKDLNQSEKDAYTQIENLKNQIKNGNIDPNVFKNLDAETKTILKSIIADD